MPTFKLPFAVVVVALVVASFALAQQETEGRADPLVQLFKEREDTLQKLVDIAKAQYDQGSCSLQSLNAAERKLLDARLESATNPRERIEILESQLRLATNREEAIAIRVKVADAAPNELMEAKVERLNVQIALQRERQK